VPAVNRAHRSGVNGLAPGRAYIRTERAASLAVRSALAACDHGCVRGVQTHRAGQDWLREEEVRRAVVSDTAVCWCHC
jgi:hypothetical protein